MKITMFAAAAALAVTLRAAPALADGPRASSSNTIPQSDAQQPYGRSASPHYEWQYHYVGHHPRYEGHWVLVN
jgi:hypothetical protein